MRTTVAFTGKTQMAFLPVSESQVAHGLGIVLGTVAGHAVGAQRMSDWVDGWGRFLSSGGWRQQKQERDESIWTVDRRVLPDISSMTGSPGLYQFHHFLTPFCLYPCSPGGIYHCLFHQLSLVSSPPSLEGLDLPVLYSDQRVDVTWVHHLSLDLRPHRWPLESPRRLRSTGPKCPFTLCLPPNGNPCFHH